MDHPTGVLRWSEILESQYGLRPGWFDGTFEAFVERIRPGDRKSVTEAFGDLETVTETEMAHGPGIDYPGSTS